MASRSPTYNPPSNHIFSRQGEPSVADFMTNGRPCRNVAPIMFSFQDEGSKDTKLYGKKAIDKLYDNHGHQDDWSLKQSLRSVQTEDMLEIKWPPSESESDRNNRLWLYFAQRLIIYSQNCAEVDRDADRRVVTLFLEPLYGGLLSRYAQLSNPKETGLCLVVHHVQPLKCIVCRSKRQEISSLRRGRSGTARRNSFMEQEMSYNVQPPLSPWVMIKETIFDWYEWLRSSIRPSKSSPNPKHGENVSDELRSALVGRPLEHEQGQYSLSPRRTQSMSQTTTMAMTDVEFALTVKQKYISDILAQHPAIECSCKFRLFNSDAKKKRRPATLFGLCPITKKVLANKYVNIIRRASNQPDQEEDTHDIERQAWFLSGSKGGGRRQQPIQNSGISPGQTKQVIDVEPNAFQQKKLVNERHVLHIRYHTLLLGIAMDIEYYGNNPHPMISYTIKLLSTSLPTPMAVSNGSGITTEDASNIEVPAFKAPWEGDLDVEDWRLLGAVGNMLTI